MLEHRAHVLFWSWKSQGLLLIIWNYLYTCKAASKEQSPNYACYVQQARRSDAENRRKWCETDIWTSRGDVKEFHTSSAVCEVAGPGSKGAMNSTLPAVNDEDEVWITRISSSCWKVQVAYACGVNIFDIILIYVDIFQYVLKDEYLPAGRHNAIGCTVWIHLGDAFQ